MSTNPEVCKTCGTCPTCGKAAPTYPNTYPYTYPNTYPTTTPFNPFPNITSGTINCTIPVSVTI